MQVGFEMNIKGKRLDEIVTTGYCKHYKREWLMLDKDGFANLALQDA